MWQPQTFQAQEGWTPQSFQPHDIPDFPNKTNQLVKGATFGFNDEATAAMVALRDAVDKGKIGDIGNTYNQALDQVRNQEKDYEKQNPFTSLGLQAVGGLGTGLGGAATKAGASIANSLRSGNLGARAAKGVLAGSASGGLYGFGTGEGDNRLENAAEGAAVGGATGGAIPLIGAASDKAQLPARISNLLSPSLNPTKGVSLIEGLRARSPDQLADTSSAMFDNASKNWSAMRDAGGVLSPEAGGNLTSSVDTALNKNLFIPQLNPQTLGIVDHLKDAVSKGPIGVDQVDQYRRLLSRVGGKEDGYSAGSVKKAVDNTLNNLGESDFTQGGPEAVKLLNQARASSSKAFRFDELSSIVQKANGDPNRIKQLLTNFVKNPDNTIGYSDEQIAAVRHAADTGAFENVLKSFGKLGLDFSKSGTGNTVMPYVISAAKAGGASLFPGGIPLVAGATLARQAQKYIARGKAEQMLKYFENQGVLKGSRNGVLSGGNQ